MRLTNRLLAFLVGVAFLAGGLLMIVEGVWTWTNSGFVWIAGASWLSTFETTEWSAPIVIGVAAGVGVAGLLLVLVQVRPHAKRVVEIRTETDSHWLLARRSTEAHLSRRLASRVPVSPIKARVKPGPRRWAVTVTARAAASTRSALDQAARDELAAIHAPTASKVRVRTTGATKAAS